jgi:hypothetical protein
MNTHVESRLEAIQLALMAHFKGGTGLPSAVIGSERENLINDYFAEVLPPIYRFGRGSITDSNNKICGQIEVVMELPFGPTLPMPAGKERLYLAESVGAIIEVKSNLSSQWKEVVDTTRKVKRLTRDLRKSAGLLLENSPEPEQVFANPEKIPTYAVGYTGYQTLEGLKNRLASTPLDERPDGALVIESGCFVGLMGAVTGVWGLYGLVAELMAQVNDVLGVAYPRISHYGPMTAEA